jgi:alpha-ribazole phosphatase
LLRNCPASEIKPFKESLSLHLPSNPVRTIALIRHGKTAENLKGAYVGRLNPPLCPQGRAELARRRFSCPQVVISSPMLRCLETAALLYPQAKPLILPDLQERDFGQLEGLTHGEIIQIPGFENWGMDASLMPFPSGEEEDAFRKRCTQGFSQVLDLLEQNQAESGAVITHGGVIMSILTHLFPHSSFYDWQADCGGGWLLTQRGSFFEAQPLPLEGGWSP